MAAAHEEGCVTTKRATRAVGQVEGMHKHPTGRPLLRDAQTTNLTNQPALGLRWMGRRAAILASDDPIGTHESGVSRAGNLEARAQAQTVHWDGRKNGKCGWQTVRASFQQQSKINKLPFAPSTCCRHPKLLWSTIPRYLYDFTTGNSKPPRWISGSRARPRPQHMTAKFVGLQQNENARI